MIEQKEKYFLKEIVAIGYRMTKVPLKDQKVICCFRLEGSQCVDDMTCLAS